MAYKTEGTVKTVEFDNKSVNFTILPTPPYSFDETVGPETQKAIVFVADAGSENTRSAKIVPGNSVFKFAFDDNHAPNLGAFLVLMQNRQKITIFCQEIKQPLSVSNISVK